MRGIYTSKGMSKFWGAHYTLGARYISKITVCHLIVNSSFVVYFSTLLHQLIIFFQFNLIFNQIRILYTTIPQYCKQFGSQNVHQKPDKDYSYIEA
jgi:hypothetical protein